ncbi:MAG TPA: hypothetical protein VD968_03755 [Pyrinomonadaceae bacterium]|nr:hypothetical protein [Pyrinomonadaceae bacterium]
MKKSSAKKGPRAGGGRSLQASVRKPVAPPGHPIARAKPEERAHPAERKAKHKRPPGDGEGVE